MLWCPGRFGFADIECEVAQDLRSHPRVVHFGMKLDRPHSGVGVFNRGHGIRRAGRQLEPWREFDRFVPVRHPDGEILGNLGKELGCFGNLDVRVPVLAFVSGSNFAAQRVHHELQPITDAENRHSEFKHLGIGLRGVCVIHGGGAAGEHDTDWRIAANLFQLGSAGQDHGKYILFTDAARDKLRILRAKVKDDDGLGFHGRVSQIGPSV